MLDLMAAQWQQGYVKFKVRKVKVHGQTKYLVDLRAIKMGRRFFDSREDAETEKESQEIRVANLGVESASFTPFQWVDATEAYKLLEPFPGVSLKSVVAFYAEAHGKRVTKKVSEASAQLVREREQQNSRPRYVNGLRATLTRFETAVGNKPVHEIDRADVQKWLHSDAIKKAKGKEVKRPASPATIRSRLIDAKTFFSFCLRQGWIASNPCASIDRVRMDDKPPGILTVAQCEALLKEAKAHQPGLIPYIALGIFAGLRPAEIQRLRWTDIDLARGHIEVSALKAKTRQRRLVQISDNLKAWLKLGGDLPCKNFAKRLKAVCEKAGIKKWPHDALRHSFASYHLAMHGSADKTATEMGHRGTDMLFRHYRELVAKEDAVRFWGIGP